MCDGWTLFKNSASWQMARRNKGLDQAPNELSTTFPTESVGSFCRSALATTDNWGYLDLNTDEFSQRITASGYTIYHPIEVGDPQYWVPTAELESLLNEKLQGESLQGLPLRTRSKVVKEKVCTALGYPVPSSFRKTRPRFVGQQLDTYVQKSLNLQIWNEELSPSRRYALVGVNVDDMIFCVKVVNGQQLAMLDTTGTITRKFQARFIRGPDVAELVSPLDTAELQPHLGESDLRWRSATEDPVTGEILPIFEVFARLRRLIGKTFTDPGSDQERNRGAVLHRFVCEELGYLIHGDTGQFPDVRHQLLEIKLQTSPTIDLGLVLPSDTSLMDVRHLGGYFVRHCDTRYAIFSASISAGSVTLTGLVLATGAEFFSRFQQFGGLVVNGKLQIPLPRNFFTS
jgi:hypothetical protein